MNNDFDTVTNLSPEKKALLAIRKMKARIEELEREMENFKSEPIAILGMGCRFPGGSTNPQEFWQHLCEGRDLITRLPAERWHINLTGDMAKSGEEAHTQWGGFLEGVDLFDPYFFGISPREASRMDPLQRILLEVSWEALENACLDVHRLAGTQTGVFMGIFHSDYARAQVENAIEHDLDPYDITGSTYSFIAGRLSYLLDFRGTCTALDTACSSSLVAVHLACQSLRNRENNLAIAGGVNLILSPTGSELIAKMQAAAADGRCKTFDARADGYVRSEGCGIIVLKRLSDALAAGDPILALIRGSACNQDGHSAGITAPNVQAQQQVIEQALRAARVAPQEIGYVETHGTGTALGDPIEVEALSAVLGQPRSSGLPCWLGAVKSNIGHAEAAAGIAGVIKAVLCLQEQEIPANLHLHTLNPNINLEQTPFQLPRQRQPWPRGAQRRFAGVSSFGISGTNAHLILEEAPQQSAPATSAQQNSAYLLPLSARSPAALVALRERYLGWLEEHEQHYTLAEVCYSASVRRSQHEYRLVVLGSHWQQMRERLAAWVPGGDDQGSVQGDIWQRQGSKLAFVFAGQGSQWVGMGRQLWEQEPIFREQMNACAELIQRQAGWSLLDIIRADPAQVERENTIIAQPVLFSLQVSLAALWQSWGIVPHAVVGQSIGEIAAAYVAGAISLEDGMTIALHRGRLVHNMRGKGAMASVDLSEHRAQSLIADYAGRISIGVISSPRSVVLSGDEPAIDELLPRIQAQHIFCRKLSIPYASHCSHMDMLEDELMRVLKPVSPTRTAIPMFSTVTTTQVDGGALDGRYWTQNLRRPVLLSATLLKMMQESYRIFIEIGPHPSLMRPIMQCLEHAGVEGTVLASLKQGGAELEELQRSLATLYVQGYPLQWQNLYPHGGQCIQLPNYPWQRRRYWFSEIAEKGQKADRGVSNRQPVRGEQQDRSHEWLYKVDWQPEALGAMTQASDNQAQSWLILADRRGTGQALAARLTEQGHDCTLIFPGKKTDDREEQPYAIDVTDIDNFKDIVSKALNNEHGRQHIVLLANLDEAGPISSASDLATKLEQSCGRLLALLQVLTQGQRSISRKLWLVTQGAYQVGQVPHDIFVAQAPIGGLHRVIALEHPDLDCIAIDMDPGADPLDVEDLLKELAAVTTENQIALRQHMRYVPRLVPYKPQHSSVHQPMQENATYLVTGGLGGLGLAVAQWLIGRGAKNLLLVGRNAPTAHIQQLLAAMAQAGVQIQTRQCDIAQEQQVQALFEQIATELPPLRGIIHAAGVLDDGVLIRQEWQRFAKVFAPKVAGSWHLHTLTQNMPLDFFILFSSAASLLGSAGQGNYAAANAFMDALAHQRRAQGLPGLSINWGAWSDIGMTAQSNSRGQGRRAINSIELIDTQQGLKVFEHLWNVETAQVAVLPIQWELFISQLPSKGISPLLSVLLRKTGDQQTVPQAAQFLQRLRDAPISEHRHLLLTHIQDQVAQVMGFDTADEVDPQRGFFDMGMDSLMAIQVRNRLYSSLGYPLASTLAFDYPTVNALTQHLMETLLDQRALSSAQLVPVAAQEHEEVGAMFAEIEQLSETDARQMLLQSNRTVRKGAK